MTTSSQLPSSESSIWIENLVDGGAGLSIKAKHALFCQSSAFQKVEVFDTYTYGRVLILAGCVVATEKDEFIYNEMIAHPALCMHHSPKKVLIIGGGDGGALRETLKHPTVKQVTVVEIDSLVVKAVKAHMPGLSGGFGDKRAKMVIDDGAAFLEKCHEKFDCIIVDSFDPGGPVQSLSTQDFYHLVKNRLADHGVAVFQTDSPTVRKDVLASALRSVSALFAQYKPYVVSIPSFPEGACSFLVCSMDKNGLDHFDAQRYAKIAKSCRCFSDEYFRGVFLLPRHIANTIG
jgi:spermidine synthase